MTGRKIKTRREAEKRNATRGTKIHIILTAITLLLLMTLPTERGGGGRRLSAREKRIERARRREHVRLALNSSADRGYYVFDELMTEKAGMIDFLAVGPVGGIVVVVRDEAGDVTADVDGTLYLDGRPFADDPKHQAAELAEEVNEKLKGTGAYAYRVICFTQASIYYLGDEHEVLKGVCPTWDLPLTFAEAAEEHTLADVAELADHIREIYRRQPFVRPEEDEGTET